MWFRVTLSVVCIYFKDWDYITHSWSIFHSIGTKHVTQEENHLMEEKKKKKQEEKKKKEAAQKKVRLFRVTHKLSHWIFCLYPYKSRLTDGPLTESVISFWDIFTNVKHRYQTVHLEHTTISLASAFEALFKHISSWRYKSHLLLMQHSLWLHRLHPAALWID